MVMIDVNRMMTSLPRSGRLNRNPLHTWQLRHKPWQIQPFILAPVLPGETLKNALIQSRCVTDPIKNPLVGWWLEYYLFYVKHRDLEQVEAREDFMTMVLDVNHTLGVTHRDELGDEALYNFPGGVAWARYCLNEVVAHYFRDGDQLGAFNIDGLPAAALQSNDWTDSLIPTSRWQDLDVDIEAEVEQAATTPFEVESVRLTAAQIDEAMRLWQMARSQGLTDMTYEDYLRSYGVRKSLTEVNRPELIRYVREWQYPSNTIDPATGAPSSAVSWAVAERVDKSRYFSEPGFVFGCTIARPKVFRNKQAGAVAGLMDNAFAWLPAVLTGDSVHSWKHVGAGLGPLPAATADYSLDIKDLLLYGDQLVNFSPDGTGSEVALPTNDVEVTKFPTLTDADALFSGTPKLVRQDGVCTLTIAGRQYDTSDRNRAEA